MRDPLGLDGILSGESIEVIAGPGDFLDPGAVVPNDIQGFIPVCC